MTLHLTFGPMKSGKSLELIRVFSPLAHTDLNWIVIQPNLHGREGTVSSRAGATVNTTKIDSLLDVDLTCYDVIGIDEVHMFSPEEIKQLEGILRAGLDIYAVGLDMDYRGRLIASTVALMELGPTSIQCLVAVCEVCRHRDARFSQVLFRGEEVTKGLPSILPEDGTYTYQARCRHCFISV